MKSKIVGADELAKIASDLRGAGQRLVVTNGCFDLLHVGHVRYLQTARSLGDILAVAVNGDASVRTLKGDGRPLNRESDRAEVLAALGCVDYVSIFPEVRATEFLRRVRPAIYVKGGDYQPETLDPEERAALQEIGAEIKIIPFEDGYSTTGLIDRMNAE
ncbi:MAG: adenylyltransferase/cytidyltransferase family protein [Chthoniobacterales bacterium]